MGRGAVHVKVKRPPLALGLRYGRFLPGYEAGRRSESEVRQLFPPGSNWGVDSRLPTESAPDNGWTADPPQESRRTPAVPRLTLIVSSPVHGLPSKTVDVETHTPTSACWRCRRTLSKAGTSQKGPTRSW